MAQEETRSVDDMARNGWRVAVGVSDAEAYAVLARDRAWNCFSIADLTPPYRAYSSYAMALRAGTADSAACLVLRHPAFAMLIPSGNPEDVDAVLGWLDLPAETQVQTRSEHLPVLRRYYGPLRSRREMLA